MLPRRLLVHRVTVVTYDYSTLDSYGNPTATETGRYTNQPALLQHGTPTEHEGDRHDGTDPWLCLMNTDPSYTIDKHSEIEWNGATFKVDGTPQEFRRPRTPDTIHHLEIAAVEVTQ